MNKKANKFTIIRNWISKVDRARVQEDARKVGSTLFGAAILGLLTDHLGLLESGVAIMVSLLLWIYGVIRNEN